MYYYYYYYSPLVAGGVVYNNKKFNLKKKPFDTVSSNFTASDM